jgi:hypothetical protein
MAYYARNMTQDATYFPPDSQNAFGDLAFGSPVAVKVRWQNKADLFRDATGREVMSSAIVYVDRDVVIGGRLGLGTLTDANEAREIRNAGKSPSLRGDVQLVKAWL